ncbi:MAG: hypothetical protein SGILL_008425, partial [Bacillariaceae sp.]
CQSPPSRLSDKRLETAVVERNIRNRRRFQDDITMLVLDDDEESGDVNDRLECILHPDVWSNTTNAGIYRNILGVGSRVLLKGILYEEAKENQNATRPVLWVEEVRLVRASSQPSIMYNLLELIRSGGIENEEAADALGLSHSDVADIATKMTPADVKWKANKLSVVLQRRQSKKSQTRLSGGVKATIAKYQHLLKKYPIHATKPIDVRSSREYTETLDIPNIAPASRWETKKLPQIEWMSQQIQAVIRGHPDYRKRKLRLLDIGGGKGLLAQHLSRTIEDVEIQVVDIAAGAIANGVKKVQRSQNWKNNRPLSMVRFQMADASSSKLDHVEADIVVGLHACGHLTDIALAHAVARCASFVIVPCCFNSNSHLTIPSDDGVEHSLVHEWLGIPEQDLSDLKFVAEVQGDVATSSLGMHLLCSIRADSVNKKHKQDSASDDSGGNVHILSFPIEFSTRNMVLVGKGYS